MSSPETLYSLSDIGRLYGVSPSAVANWRARGSGPALPAPAYRTSAGRPLYTRAQLEALIAERHAALDTFEARELQPADNAGMSSPA